jgi:hypothetical protein
MSMSFARIVRTGALAAALLATAPAWAQSGIPADDELAGGGSSPPMAGPRPSPSAEPEADPAAEAPPARPERRRRAELRPYLEVNLGASAELSGGNDDVVTYSTAAVGVDGHIETRRVTAQASYRYERVIPIEGGDVDENSHSGVAMVHVEAAPGLSLDAGALAARTGGEGRSAGGVTVADDDTQVVSAYVGPTLSYQFGPLSVGASYRFGYVRVEDDTLAGGPLTSDRFDESTVHNATASIGMAPGRLPIGWTVGGGYVREDSGDLNNRFEGEYVRGDIVVPVGATLALTAGVGYETYRSSSDDILRDANGLPVIVNGRLVSDPSRPRIVGMDQDGVIYDGGIIWRPGPRTELQARAGRRYGGTTVTGSLQHRFRTGWGLAADVYDSVGTSATAIVNNVNHLPDDFTANRNPLTGAFDGCVFGREPGSGICFDQALQSLSNSGARTRGGNLMFSGTRGPWDIGVGGGYANHRYTDFFSGSVATIGRRTDESAVLNAGLSRRLSRYSGASIDAYASWYDSDRPMFEAVTGSGVTGSYYRNFLMERLQFHAALGLYRSDGLVDSTILSGLAGLRFSF